MNETSYPNREKERVMFSLQFVCSYRLQQLQHTTLYTSSHMLSTTVTGFINPPRRRASRSLGKVTGWQRQMGTRASTEYLSLFVIATRRSV